MNWWRAFPSRWIRSAFWALVCLAAVPAPGFAVGPIVWMQQAPSDFERGKPDGVAVAARGGLLLARAVREIPIKELREDAQPFLWSQALDSKGNLYAGSGNDGRVFKVSKGGQGSLLFSTGDLAVQALAVDARDYLFVGTSPEGKIYRVNPEGKSEVWFDPEERYIWALAVDRSGNLFAATGEKGIIYKVTDQGKGVPFYDSPESHIVTLAFDRQGNLLAGSSGKGLLYRIAPDGKGTVLLDTALKEVNAVAVDPSGKIYASAIQSDAQPLKQVTPARAVRLGDVSVTATPTEAPSLATLEGEEEVRSGAGDAGQSAETKRAKGILYRVDPDGTSTTVWVSEEETAFSLVIPSEHEVYLGTGDLGKIRRLGEDGGSQLAAKLPASQVTSLVASPDGTMFAATSNAGGLFALEKDVSESGTFVSPPRDAASLARWGQIVWTGEAPSGSKVEVFTRSGNSAVPDNTWSDWSPAYTSPGGNKVVSPSARFIQWKARLSRQSKGTSPFLESVSLTYLPSNLTPKVESITVNPPGVIVVRMPLASEPDAAETAFSQTPSPPAGTEFGSPFPLPPIGKKIFRKGMRSVDWKATDPNGDTMRYDLYFRGDGEKEWKPLVRGCMDTYFAWDSTLMPDGRYRLRVIASDAPANPASDARTAETVGEAFVVDNSPPIIEAISKKEGGSPYVDIKATDSASPVRSLEYSLDAARWILVMPSDGVADSMTEQFKIPLERLGAGEHTLMLKATDSEGNVGSARVLLSGSS
jgi:sugar lactone lactonase YvrE